MFSSQLRVHSYTSYLFMYMRRKGIVVQESIEGFRQHLAKLQNMKGLTSEEKGKTVMSGFIVYIAIASYS